MWFRPSPREPWHRPEIPNAHLEPGAAILGRKNYECGTMENAPIMAMLRRNISFTVAALYFGATAQATTGTPPRKRFPSARCARR